MIDAPAALLRARVQVAAALEAAHKASGDDRDAVERVIGRGHDKLAALALLLLAGSITRSTFIERAQTLLADTIRAGAAAGGAGRSDAAQIADALLERQSGYLDDFADELDAATPESGMSAAAATARMALYAGLAWTAFQQARTADAPEDQQFDWVLEAGAAHCDDCQANADGGPYTRDTLPGYPGDANTQCVSNCRCKLEPVDG